MLRSISFLPCIVSENLTAMLWSKVEVTSGENQLQLQLKSNKSPASVAEIISNHVPLLAHGSRFLVSPPLYSGHTQTWYTALRGFEDRDLIHYGRRLVEIDPENKGYMVDGDRLLYDKFQGKSTLTLDYVITEDNCEHIDVPRSQNPMELPPRTDYISFEKESQILLLDKPLLVALHGLSGGSHELYLRALVSEITKNHGFEAVVVNSRGCAGHLPTTPQLFNGLWTNDVRYVLNEHIPLINPNKPIYMVGFSLGGSILANFLGQEAESVSSQIRGACVMAAPWDFVEGSVELESSFLGYHVYSPTMLQSLLKLLDLTYKHLEKNPVVASVGLGSKFPLLRDFDDAVTLKMFGFHSAVDYYRHALPSQRLDKIRVPTLVILSLDDPIVGTKCLPYSETKINPFVTMATTTCGGHLGWFDWKGQRWYPGAVSKLFRELHENWTWSPSDANAPKRADNWKHDRIVQ